MQQGRSTIRCRNLLLGVMVAAAATLAIASFMPPAEANPPCSGRYTVNNGVVLDNDTKLTWQQNFGESLTVEKAVSYCNSQTIGGFDDFRLPTVFELQTLVDDSRGAPLIDGKFPSTPNDIFWTSTKHTQPSACPCKPPDTCPPAACNWYVNFGYTFYELVQGDDVTKSHYVRCVR